MHKADLVKTLVYIKENNLSEKFNETTNILSISIKIRMYTTEAEIFFSTLERIKIYLKNKIGQTRLNSLSVISIGRDLVKNCSGFSNEGREMFKKRSEECILITKEKSNNC